MSWLGEFHTGATFLHSFSGFSDSWGYKGSSSSSVDAEQPPKMANTAEPGFFLDVCCGANAPLSDQLRLSGIQCVCVDALGSEPLDLLEDSTYDSILLLAFSGVVRMAHAAPPCKEYSRLKLRPGGPRAIRSPEFLNGLPENTTEQQQRVLTSQKLMYRSVCVLRAVFASGGHVSLEQPANSMAWLEPLVQDFLSEIQATLSVVAACSVGVDVAKQWLFASSFAPLKAMAATCSHQGQHASVIGARDAKGNFLSQRTAAYPTALAVHYSKLVNPLFCGYVVHDQTAFCSLSFALQCIPRKGRNAPPFGAQDRGGIYSTPDWSYGPRYQSDLLCDLRKEWRQWLLEKHIPERLAQHVSEHRDSPLFSESETAWLQQSFKRFSDQHSLSQDWDFSVPEGQPYCLSALSRLSRLVADKDTSLFPAPLQGHQLLICEGNWKGAEEDPALLQQLVEEEIEAGSACFSTAFVPSGPLFRAIGSPALVGSSPWLSHVLLLYVDDLLLFQNSKVLPLSAALTLAFCARFTIPLSWKKLQLGQTITWIGWEINLSCACCSLPEAKRNKLYELVSECLRHRQVSRKQLDKLLGLLQWILHGMPTLRPWLSSLYDDMHRPLGTNVSVSPTLWAGLDEELRFTSSPPSTAVSKGAKLLSARHVELLQGRPLQGSGQHQEDMDADSVAVLRFFQHLSSVEWRPRPLRPPALVAVTTAADAFGKGNQCGVGGWLKFPSGRMVWFSQPFTVQQFTALGIPVQSDANLDISSYETLAQCFILLAFWKFSGAGRLALKLPALSDNSGAEAVCNKLYTSKTSLNFFVRKLCMWSSLSGITLDCSHIAGEKNDDADFLS
ncbi:unnamed protein product, partial [Symbiodinium sp. CCMP2456]